MYQPYFGCIVSADKTRKTHHYDNGNQHPSKTINDNVIKSNSDESLIISINRSQ